MARSKTPAGFITNDRNRRRTFVKRRKGLVKKAGDLSTLCGTPVAVVCADPEGGPPVMETVPGVLDRYRALPADWREGHTHRRYLEALLAKEKAKLARVRQAGPDALAPPHEMMSRMTMEELRRLQETIEASMAATAERMGALGLPLPGDDDDAVVAVPSADSGPWAAGSDDGCPNPMQQGQGDANIDHGLLDQETIQQGLQAHGDVMIPLDYYGYRPEMNMLMQPAYDPQFNGGYQQQQMPSNGGYYYGDLIAPGACFQPQYTIAQPEHGGFQYDGSSSSHVGTSSSMEAAINFNNGAFLHDLSMWGATGSSSAIAGYPYTHTSPPEAEYPDQITDNNFLDMVAGGNGMNYLGGYDYETQGSSSNLHLAGYETQGSSNNLQYSGASQNSSSVQDLFGSRRLALRTKPSTST